MNSMKLGKLYFFVTLGLLMLGCSSSIGESDTPEKNEIEHMKSMLLEAGYHENEIQVLENSFVIEGDMVLPFASFYVEDGPKTKQAFGGSITSSAPWNTVSQSNVSNIKVKLSPTSNWYVNNSLSLDDVIEDALDNWENISQSKINFTIITSGTPDITFYIDEDPNIPPDFLYGGAAFNWDDLQSGVAARAMIPNNTIQSGKPGTVISINKHWGSAVTSNQWEKIITHEIGHTLGFHHTDWSSSEFYTNPTTVPGTNNNDPNSVMDSNPDAYNWTPWSGFSTNDLKAARLLYPSAGTPSLLSQGTLPEDNGYLPVNFQFSYFYHYTLYIYSRLNGGSWTLIDTIQYPTASKTIYLPTGETGGTVSVRVRSKSYIGNEYSPYSPSMDFIANGSSSDECDPTLPCFD